MSKLLMISGDRSLAEGKHGAFYNTLEEFHKYWERIDVITPKLRTSQLVKSIFGNVFLHPSSWPLIVQPFWILKKGKQIYKEQKFDFVTVHEYPPFYNGIGARLLWNKIRVPYILEIHHIPGFPKAADFKERFYRNLVRFFIGADSGKATAVRTVNEKQVPSFLIKAGVPREKIIFIPSLYIDLDTFRPMGLDKKYDLVFAARLEKNKGIGLLLEAISNVKTAYSAEATLAAKAGQIPNIKLLIIGTGPMKRKLEDYVERKKLENNVFFSGWLETPADVADALNKAKIFINPSFNEGGPRAALEALACGLPIITTRVGLMPDIINDGENGLFSSWEPAEMADKIIQLLNSPKLQNKFSLASRNLVRQFEKKEAIKNYANRLKEVVNSKQ